MFEPSIHFPNRKYIVQFCFLAQTVLCVDQTSQENTALSAFVFAIELYNSQEEDAGKSRIRKDLVWLRSEVLFSHYCIFPASENINQLTNTNAAGMLLNSSF